MITWFKRTFYFLVARYFGYFAKKRLKQWNPRVIVVTGSSGKTTLLHLLEAQLGKRARYSHHANSAIGIPFDILGLKRHTLEPHEWPMLLLKAPFLVNAPFPPENLYIVEADCDRPGEGRFLGELLTPEVTLWLNATRTHSMNFDQLVEPQGNFATVEEAISREFGQLSENTKNLVIANADLSQVTKELTRTKARVARLHKKKLLASYQPGLNRTGYTIHGKKYAVPALAVEDVWYAIAACVCTLEYLKIPVDPVFTRYIPPPGRSSVFHGRRGIRIIDSSYNANLSSMTNVLSMFDKLPVRKKWLVISDMLEQGEYEEEEHRELAKVLAFVKAERVILMGPRVRAHTEPVLKKLLGKKTPLVWFAAPKEVLTYLEKEISGRETILFKGGRFLEGVIEHLLANPDEATRLCRREKAWVRWRKKWGL